MASGAPPPGDCSLCGNPRRSTKCMHPWHLPFQKWPNVLLDELTRLVKGG